jgi:hypothetical protein
MDVTAYNHYSVLKSVLEDCRKNLPTDLTGEEPWGQA